MSTDPLPPADGGENNFMYPLCDPSSSTNYPCTGVVGAATKYQVTYKQPFDKKFYYETLLRNTDECTGITDPEQCKCSSVSNGQTLLGFYDKSGWCIKPSIGQNINIQQNHRICIGSQQDSHYYYKPYDNKYPSFDMYNGIIDPQTLEAISNIFPIQSMHKVWGSGSDENPNNRGVNSRNVFVKNIPETVTTKYPTNTNLIICYIITGRCFFTNFL